MDVNTPEQGEELSQELLNIYNVNLASLLWDFKVVSHAHDFIVILFRRMPKYFNTIL